VNSIILDVLGPTRHCVFSSDREIGGAIGTGAVRGGIGGAEQTRGNSNERIEPAWFVHGRVGAPHPELGG